MCICPYIHTYMHIACLEDAPDLVVGGHVHCRRPRGDGDGAALLPEGAQAVRVGTGEGLMCMMEKGARVKSALCLLASSFACTDSR